MDKIDFLVYILTAEQLSEEPISRLICQAPEEASFLMNVLTLIIAGCLTGYLLYLLWRISSGLWKSRDNFFLVMRFALTAAFLALIGYTLYQNFDLGDLLLGLLSLFLGILLLSILLAVVERLEKNFELKKGSTKDNKTPLT
jgi:hypothetical protein